MSALLAAACSCETGPTLPVVERRVHRRVALKALLEVEGGGAILSGSCRNISVGGLAARLQGSVALGAELKLRLTLPGGPQIEIRGEVVRVDAPDVAVRFLALEQRALLGILAYVVDH